MQKPASEIRVGDKIVLQDRKTNVIVEAIGTLENINVQGQIEGFLIYWLYEGQRRHMIYALDENIEVIE